MENNGLYDELVDGKVTSEEAFEGNDSNLGEDVNERIDLNDYSEVSNSNESQDTLDETIETPFEGGNTIQNEESLEHVEGYDYKALDNENDAIAENSKNEAAALDAFYAEYGDPNTAQLLKTESGQKMLQEVVIGKDDRIRINATNNYPWRAICSLKIKAKDGTNWIGTGFLIGPRTVITAGHCVYMRKHGGWAQSIEVIPGRNGSQKPYGSCHSTKFHSVKGWTKSNKRSHDYGAIILPSNCKLGNTVGYFGYGNYATHNLRKYLSPISI